jgi:basic membrane lipoprotein Med (substrate-binding protein (PBP1-ABC) superfamily)
MISHEVVDFKVAMILPASIDDKGWNALAYDALLTIEEELDAIISPVESHTLTEHEADLRRLATEGYNLIFAHGYEYGAPAKIVAPDFPEKVFVISSGDVVAENIASINFQIEPATYLLGIIAGMMTKTKKIGVIGGQDFPSVIRAFDAFETGVKSVNPDAEVSHDYVGNWEDVAKGKKLAMAQIGEGIDFIFPNADVAGRGVFMAVEEAHAAGNVVYTFGANRDQSTVSPTTVIANAVITPRPFVEIAELVKDGTFTPQIYTYTMSTDRAIDMVYNPALIDKVPEIVKTKVAEAKTKILSGELIVPAN